MEVPCAPPFSLYATQLLPVRSQSDPMRSANELFSAADGDHAVACLLRQSLLLHSLQSAQKAALSKCWSTCSKEYNLTAINITYKLEKYTQSKIPTPLYA